MTRRVAMIGGSRMLSQLAAAALLTGPATAPASPGPPLFVPLVDRMHNLAKLKTRCQRRDRKNSNARRRQAKASRKANR